MNSFVLHPQNIAQELDDLLIDERSKTILQAIRKLASLQEPAVRPKHMPNPVKFTSFKNEFKSARYDCAFECILTLDETPQVTFEHKAFYGPGPNGNPAWIFLPAKSHWYDITGNLDMKCAYKT